MKKIYLTLAIIWLIIPYFILIRWLYLVDFNVIIYLKNTFENIENLFWISDVVISAIVLIIFMIKNKKENNVNIVFPLMWTLLVWVSFWLPLYLYLIEKNKKW